VRSIVAAGAAGAAGAAALGACAQADSENTVAAMAANPVNFIQTSDWNGDRIIHSLKSCAADALVRAARILREALVKRHPLNVCYAWSALSPFRSAPADCSSGCHLWRERRIAGGLRHVDSPLGLLEFIGIYMDQILSLLAREWQCTVYPHQGQQSTGECKMSVFSRLSDIINANLNSLLDKAEDPEKIVRLMIQEMEDTLVEVRSAAAKVIAERKERERQLSLLDLEQSDWQHKAELALRKDREDLARAALSHKAALGDQHKAVAQDLTILGDNLVKLNDDIAKLQAKLQDAKARQRTIVIRAQNAQTSLKARTQIHSAKIDDMLNRFDYAERRIDSVEAQAEALDLGRAKTLNQAFADLESEDRIKGELEALKARLQQPKG